MRTGAGNVDLDITGTKKDKIQKDEQLKLWDQPLDMLRSATESINRARD